MKKNNLLFSLLTKFAKNENYLTASRMICKRLFILVIIVSIQASILNASIINGKNEEYVAGDSLNMKIMVPAYFDPSSSDYWSRLATESAKMPGALYAIANVNSGPGTQYSAAYNAVINNMHDSSGKVIGYVHTSYGSRPFSAVKADIDAWYSFYPSLDGIFIDEQANVSGQEPYYSEIYNYIKQKDSTALVVTNPGANTIESYLFYNGKRISDVICIFETSTGFDTWTPAAWCSKYSSDNFYVIPYSTSSSQYINRINRALSLKIGWTFFTDAGGSNPYNTLPSYFEDYCNYIITGKVVTTINHNKINIDGNFSDWQGINSLNTLADSLDSTYSKDPNANFTNAWATNDSTNLYISYQVAGNISTTNYYHIFIDTDGDSSGKTGYVYNDSASIGAEFMVENSSLWSYTGTGGSNWSWSSISGMQEAVSGGRSELSIPLKVLFPKGIKNTVKIIFQTNLVASPYSLMDVAPNNYKTQSYTYQINSLTDVKQNGNKNVSYYLGQNYPNPFNPSTIITYQIPKTGLVKLTIYDMLGREIQDLVNKEQSSGTYSVTFNSATKGISLASGIYLYRLQSDNFIETKKMLLIK
ncbi:MAG: spherulation-specific family 4 protein [Ignavibacteriaceae bacterium]